MRPLSCPICGNTLVEAVLNQIPIVATVNKQSTEVGGLKAFQCRVQGHIFFVRATDLETTPVSAITASSYQRA